ncbi:MAG: sigma-70 family RNA polymerase sigma factor [Rhizobiaceae bacterium]|nr:sigma-70 family RNA polymerase sigma factor [Rhizobiaceae bacterium]
MNAQEDSDGQLVQRAIAGDRAGFAALVSRHYDLIFRVAWKWSGNREDAEDIAQDVCARLGRSITSYSGSAQFTTWLYQVVLNATRDHYRKQQANSRKLKEFSNEPTQSLVQMPSDGGDEDALTSLWQAVRKLPTRQCDAIMLVFGEELTHGEAAKVMGCAEGTVSSNIHDAKKRLKLLLVQEASI